MMSQLYTTYAREYAETVRENRIMQILKDLLKGIDWFRQGLDVLDLARLGIYAESFLAEHANSVTCVDISEPCWASLEQI